MKRITLSNATPDAIERAMKGEKVPSLIDERDLIRCEYCDKLFLPNRKTQRFCTTKFRVYHHRNVED